MRYNDLMYTYARYSCDSFIEKVYIMYVYTHGGVCAQNDRAAHIKQQKI